MNGWVPYNNNIQIPGSDNLAALLWRNVHTPCCTALVLASLLYLFPSPSPLATGST